MIGAGTVSQAIAGDVAKTGHDVVFSNSRGPQTLGDVVDDSVHTRRLAPWPRREPRTSSCSP
jgi:predicted dinucleotide-binding enzyme